MTWQTLPKWLGSKKKIKVFELGIGIGWTWKCSIGKNNTDPPSLAGTCDFWRVLLELVWDMKAVESPTAALVALPCSFWAMKSTVSSRVFSALESPRTSHLTFSPWNPPSALVLGRPRLLQWGGNTSREPIYYFIKDIVDWPIGRTTINWVSFAGSRQKSTIIGKTKKKSPIPGEGK